jgi:hypothetical protein
VIVEFVGDAAAADAWGGLGRLGERRKAGLPRWKVGCSLRSVLETA